MAPHASFTHSVPCALSSTVLVLRMAHRILKETKQEPGKAGPGNMLGSCLVSFHFLSAILSTSTVQAGPSGRGRLFVDINLKVPP